MLIKWLSCRSNFLMLEFGLLFDVLMEAEPNPSSRHYQYKEGDVYHPHCIDKTLLSLRMKFHWCVLLIRLYFLTLNVYEKGQVGPRSPWRPNHGNYSTIDYLLSVLPELHNIHTWVVARPRRTNIDTTSPRCIDVGKALSRVTRPHESSLSQWDCKINLTSIRYIFSINYLTSITVRYSYTRAMG